MGAFPSKALAKEKPENEAVAEVQSGNQALAVVQSGGESEHKDGSSKKMNCSSLVKASPDGFSVSIPMLIGGAACVILGVAARYGSYVYAEKTLKICDETIQTIQSSFEKIPPTDEDSGLLRDLATCKKRREHAVVYLKRHQLMGKIVHMFHPPDI